MARGIVGWRSGNPLVRAFSRLSALGAVAAVGLVVVDVLGDGFFEIAKHVWLAAYLLVVTAIAAVAAVAAGGHGLTDAAPRSRLNPLARSRADRAEGRG